MPLLGSAAVAMWWDIAPAQRTEFEDWHTHEHFPERLGIPGFQRGSRWADAAGGEGYFVMYELESYETLTSSHYLARLNDPTPWSTKMMPHHRHMVRSQCRVLEAFGGGVAASMLTVRVSPRDGAEQTLRTQLRSVLGAIVSRPGLTGAHLLQTQTPASSATKEQRIRGGDGVADWIVLASGYDTRVLSGLASGELGGDSLAAWGAQPGAIASIYALSYAMTSNDRQ